MSDKAVIRIYIACFVFIVCYFFYGIGVNVGRHEDKKLSLDERRAIAIQFEKDYGSWRSTLHNPCNFSPMDADKETKK